ncbi:hypothetical protein M0R72_11490 [Candidatus Pacearchaeota archaeon]|jgi:hypothetical protein|nr:hypothetical protein [Candidatus Pacearchaeota archaeon]
MWTSPRTWSADEIVTAAQFNEQIRDNLDLLKSRVDLLQDIESNTVDKKVDGTQYTNGDRIRLVSVYVSATATSADGTISLLAKVGADEVIKSFSFQYINGSDVLCHVNFIVPPGDNYSVTESHNNTNTVGVLFWDEQDWS